MTKPKDERASMFNAAQQRDIEKKHQATKAAKAQTEEVEGEKIFTIRIPKSLWIKMMHHRIETGKSLNQQVKETLESRFL